MKISNSISIRPALEADARRISYLIQKNTEKNFNNYTAQQLQTWKGYNSPKGIRSQLKNRIIFCAFQYNRLIGTIGLQDNEVVGLYVSYSKTGLGIGRLLLAHLEKYAMNNGIKTLELTSTPSGKPFYLKNGFKEGNQVIVTINGVDFIETEMRKEL